MSEEKSSVMLGQKVSDTITPFRGTVIGICQFLTGTTRYLIASCELGKDGQVIEQWYDAERLKDDQSSQTNIPK